MASDVLAAVYNTLLKEKSNWWVKELNDVSVNEWPQGKDGILEI